MEKLKSALYGAIFLIASTVSTPVLAGAGDFAGPFIAVQAASAGVEMDGSHTDEDGAITKGSVGGLTPLAGLELGYNIPVSDNVFITVGGVWNSGSAKATFGTDSESNASTSVTLSNHMTGYIQPSISFGETSAAFLKLGVSEADLSAEGDVTPGQPGDLSGITLAIGTASIFPSGIYVKTEAGFTDYDDITINGVGGSSSAKVVADPGMAYGQISIGYKF